LHVHVSGVLTFTASANIENDQQAGVDGGDAQRENEKLFKEQRDDGSNEEQITEQVNYEELAGVSEPKDEALHYVFHATIIPRRRLN
jgi:hypothetical protein